MLAAINEPSWHFVLVSSLTDRHLANTTGNYSISCSTGPVSGVLGFNSPGPIYAILHVLVTRGGLHVVHAIY